MKAFTSVTSISAYVPIANIDTDMIIPKQYLKTIKRSGLGQYLFAELRYDAAGQKNPEFILNRMPFAEAEILIAGENFGCGSSREHAAWSLLDFGIKVIIAPSFADIFYNNAYKNGIVLITLSKDEIASLISNKEPITVDLALQKISAQGINIAFQIEPYRRTALLEGLDDIDATLKYQAEIKAFELQQQQQQPWLYKDKKS